MMRKWMVLTLFLIGLLVLSGCSGTGSDADAEQDSIAQNEEGTILDESPIDFSKINFDVKVGPEEGGGSVLVCTFTNDTGLDMDRVELVWTEKEKLGKDDRDVWVGNVKAYIEALVKEDTEIDLSREEDKATYDYMINYADQSKLGANAHVLYLDNGGSESEDLSYYDWEFVPITDDYSPGLDLNGLYEMLEPYSMEVLFTDGDGNYRDLKYLFGDQVVLEK